MAMTRSAGREGLLAVLGFVAFSWSCASCDRAGGGGVATPVVHCGGIAGTPCPGGSTCVDDPSDSCDPTGSGRDCGGICVPEAGGEGGEGRPDAGTVTGGEGRRDAGVRRDAGRRDAGRRDGGARRDAGGAACGVNVCGAGEFCCNQSCGICAPEGGFCIQLACEPDAGR